MNIGQPEVAALIAMRQPFMVKAEAMQNGGIEIVDVENGIQMEVRHWGEKKPWFVPQPDPTTVWVFEHSGLCEPISVRFTLAGRTIGARGSGSIQPCAWTASGTANAARARVSARRSEMCLVMACLGYQVCGGDA